MSRTTIRPRARWLMTREEFESWFARKKNNALYVRAPYTLGPCTCKDVNCHGWRFVQAREVR